MTGNDDRPATITTPRRPAASATLLLRAACLLARRYDEGQERNILAAMRSHPASGEYASLLNRITIDLLGLARRELSVRQAATGSLLHQDVSVLLARTTLAAYPFTHPLGGAGRPSDPAAWETLVAMVTVAYVHEDAGTPGGAAKLRDEVNRVWETLFDQGGQPS